MDSHCSPSAFAAWFNGVHSHLWMVYFDPSMPDGSFWFVLGKCGLLRTCGRWLWITSTSIHQYSPTSWGFGVDFARIVSRCHHGGSQEGMAAVFAALWLSWMLMWGPSGKSPSCQQQWTDFDIISMFGATAPQRPIVLTCCGHSLLQSADFESPSHRIPCRIPCRLRLLDEMSKSQAQADVKSFGAAMSGLDLLVECYEGR